MSTALSPGQPFLSPGGEGPPLEWPLAPDSVVRMELRWDADPEKARLKPHRPGELPGDDLDASVMLLDAQGEVLETVWYRHPHGQGGAVNHSGDDRTGAGRAPDHAPEVAADESVTVALSALDPAIQTLVFTVTNYSEEGLGQVSGATCRLVNAVSGQEIVQVDLSAQGQHNALILASVTRRAGGWQLRVIGAPTSGRTYFDTLPAVRRLLSGPRSA